MSKKKILAILTGTATVATVIAAYEAKKKADAEYERVLKNADEEAAAKMQQAEEAIKVEKEKSMREMQDEIKDLVVSVASKVVGDQVSAEDSSRLYDDFIAEMGEKK